MAISRVLSHSSLVSATFKCLVWLLRSNQSWHVPCRAPHLSHQHFCVFHLLLRIALDKDTHIFSRGSFPFLSPFSLAKPWLKANREHKRKACPLLFRPSSAWHLSFDHCLQSTETARSHAPTTGQPDRYLSWRFVTKRQYERLLCGLPEKLDDFCPQPKQIILMFSATCVATHSWIMMTRRALVHGVSGIPERPVITCEGLLQNSLSFGMLWRPACEYGATYLLQTWTPMDIVPNLWYISLEDYYESRLQRSLSPFRRRPCSRLFLSLDLHCQK